MNALTVKTRGIIIHDGKLLVVRHPKRDFYALPGGHLEHGETPVECMKREVKEELGVEAKVGDLLVVYSFVNQEGVQSIEFFFKIENGEFFNECEKLERSHSFEIEEMRWVGVEDAVIIRPFAFHEAWRAGLLENEKTIFLSDAS